MKLILVILAILVLKCNAFAQQEFHFDDDDLVYATIKDTDGFVNVREAPSANAPIVRKIYKNTLFSCESNITNWWKVFQVNNNDRSDFIEGYIYKDKVSLLKNWKDIKRNNISADSGVFKQGNLTIVIKQRAFHIKHHKLLYSQANTQEHNTSELLKIDGKLIWGTDGEIPKKVLVSVKIAINGTPVILPKSAFEDLYEPSLNISVCKGPDDVLYISMSNNSDGAGSYTVIWIIKGNKYIDRYIDNSMV